MAQYAPRPARRQLRPLAPLLLTWLCYDRVGGWSGFVEKAEGTGLANFSEASYAVVAMQLLPNGLLGLMVVAMFAAAMSTMDTALNANAAIVTIDVIPTIRRKLGLEPISDVGGLRLGQIFTLLFGACTILMALFFLSLRDFNIFTLIEAVG